MWSLRQGKNGVLLRKFSAYNHFMSKNVVHSFMTPVIPDRKHGRLPALLGD
jgi:hypothetical protein